MDSMMLRSILVVAVLTIAGCGTPNTDIRETPNEKAGTRTIDPKPSLSDINTRIYQRIKTSPSTFSLYGRLEEFNLEGFKFFGSFYDDRLKIYKSLQTDGSLGDAPIKEFIIYFFDEVLVKTQYQLTGNAANFLLNRMRVKPVIRTSDEANKAIVRSGKIIEKVDDRIVLNNALTVYELEWDLQDREVLLRVDERSIAGPDIRAARYLYISQVVGFQALVEGHFQEELI